MQEIGDTYPERIKQKEKMIQKARLDMEYYFARKEREWSSNKIEYMLEQLAIRKQKHEEDYRNLCNGYKAAKSDLQRGNPYESILTRTKDELIKIDQELNAA